MSPKKHSFEEVHKLFKTGMITKAYRDGWVQHFIYKNDATELDSLLDLPDNLEIRDMITYSNSNSTKDDETIERENSIIVNDRYDVRLPDGSVSFGWTPTTDDLFAIDWIVVPVPGNYRAEEETGEAKLAVPLRGSTQRSIRITIPKTLSRIIDTIVS